MSIGFSNFIEYNLKTYGSSVCNMNDVVDKEIFPEALPLAVLVGLPALAFYTIDLVEKRENDICFQATCIGVTFSLLSAAAIGIIFLAECKNNPLIA